jgi:ADP-glucose pyrophosphorylase
VRRGILELDENGKVVSFLEKPKPTDTTSRKANPCLYLFSKDSLPLISQFLQEKKEAPMKEKDATGNFVKYLHSRRPVYTYEISGRYDIGGLESYLHCCSNYRPPSNQSQTL